MIYVFLFFLSFSLNAQILLNESFSDFRLSALDSTKLLLDFSRSDFQADQSPTEATFVVGGGLGDSLIASILLADNYGVYFDASNDTMYNLANEDVWDFGTSDFTVECFWKPLVVSPADVMLMTKRNVSATGFEFSIYNGTQYSVIRNGVANIATGVSVSAGTDYYTASRFDRDSNLITNLNWGLDNTQNISAYSAVDLTNAFPLAIGMEAKAPTLTLSRRIKSYFYTVRITKRLLTDREVSEAGRLAKNWISLSGGVTRDGWLFSQGVVNDTIYYKTALTAGSWTITLSDSAASGVSYEVLTSADATTWATLASGTTGTSWGSKSYSGTGTGYLAIAVASGTAFFDDLVVRLAGGEKEKYNGYKGWLGY